MSVSSNTADAIFRTVWCGALGPLVVQRADGSIVSVGGWARRLLFGALLSRAGRTVSPDVLIDDVWGVAPPRSAAKTLQSHIVRLRHDLGRDESDRILVTERTGYRLVLGPEDFDVTQFERRVSDALVAQAAGELQPALARLDEALVLWRGEAYEEFTDSPFSVAERLRLFDLRADAQEHRTDIALALGQSGELVSDLEKRVAAAPYRERGWEQLIVALYRAGRQADALGAYRRASTVLAEDLGIDPGPTLRELEVRILRQDPDLLGPLPPRTTVLVAPRLDVCPYRGLASYTDADSDLFVGRERLTAELVGRLADSHLVVLTGASGTGKSSALRAGLVAALPAGALPGSASWRSAVVTPADDLKAALTAELDLVVLDQAEELFTRLPALERRAAVVNKIQSPSLRSRRLGVVAAAVLSLAACMPAVSSTHTFREASLGVAGSANALEHLYLGHLALSGSANAVEYIYLSHLKAERGGAGSANAADHAG